LDVKLMILRNSLGNSFYQQYKQVLNVSKLADILFRPKGNVNV
jgi:hypothetical protein